MALPDAEDTSVYAAILAYLSEQAGLPVFKHQLILCKSPNSLFLYYVSLLGLTPSCGGPVDVVTHLLAAGISKHRATAEVPLAFLMSKNEDISGTFSG